MGELGQGHQGPGTGGRSCCPDPCGAEGVPWGSLASVQKLADRPLPRSQRVWCAHRALYTIRPKELSASSDSADGNAPDRGERETAKIILRPNYARPKHPDTMARLAPTLVFAMLLGFAAARPKINPAQKGVVAKAKAVKKSSPQRMSEAIPFLEAPPKLDGTLLGDIGFDPLGARLRQE